MKLEYQGLDNTEVGQCDMQLVISQIPANGDGWVDNFNVERSMDPVRYDFKVTVEPCKPTLTSVTAPGTMTYTLADPNISEPYQFD